MPLFSVNHEKQKMYHISIFLLFTISTQNKKLFEEYYLQL